MTSITNEPQPDQDNQQYISSRAYRLAYGPENLAIRAFLRFMAPRLDTSGRRNVPRRGPVIIAPNHISDADPAVISAALRRSAWYMAKDELFDIPVLAPAIRFWQAFPVDKEGTGRAALRRAENLLKNGQAVVIFPEGQCSETGQLQPVMAGIALLALRAGVPVIPVGIVGTDKAMPYAKLIPRFTLGRVHVHFGRPLDFSNLKTLPSRAQREAVVQQVHAALEEVVAIAGRA